MKFSSKRLFSSDYETLLEGTDQDLQEFKEHFLSITQLLGFLSNDDIFKKEHGFSMTEYISERRSCANSLHEVADSIEKVVHDTGIARTTGGSVAVASGAAALGGILLAPFTAGTSLALTVGGIVGGVASAATTLTAAIIKDQKVKEKGEEVKQLLDSLERKDKVVGAIMEDLQQKVEVIRELYKKKNIKDFMEDGVQIGLWIKGIGYNVAYKGYTVYTSVKAIRFASAVAEFIQADIYAMRGVATGLSAPGLSIFGKTIILAGSTTAKIFSGALSVVGIGVGIWDIVEGANDINGSEHADAYRKAARDLDEQTDGFAELLEKIKPQD